MRSILALVLASSIAYADDPARALVEKAIQAHGGPDKVARLRTMRVKADGTMTLVPGQPAQPFAIEDVWQMPDKYRTASTFTFMGRKVTQALVINGDKGWMAADGQTQDLPKEAVAEMREQKYAEDLDRLGFLNHKDTELSAAGEAEVNGKPALGVRVRSKGHRDVTLHFDKATGLLVKRTHPILDPATDKLVIQEVAFGDYQEKDGVKHWRTITAHRGGKKVIEAKATEIEFLDKVDPKLFARP